MFIAEIPQDSKCPFFIKEDEEQGELRNALLSSAVGHLTLGGNNDYFPLIYRTLEMGARFLPPNKDTEREYSIHDPGVLQLLATETYQNNIHALQGGIDRSAALGSISMQQWYTQREEACMAANTFFMWIDKDGCASEKAAFDGENLRLAPMQWSWEWHGSRESEAGGQQAEEAEIARVIGANVVPFVLSNYKVEEVSLTYHSFKNIGQTIGRMEGQNFAPLMTILSQHPEDNRGFSHSLRFCEMWARDGDEIVPITRPT